MIEQMTDAKRYPTKEELQKDYEIDFMRFDDIRKRWGLSKKTLSNLIHVYGLKRVGYVKRLPKKGGIEDGVLKGIYPSKEQILEVFINENKNRKESADFFGITEQCFRSLLKYYDIKKTSVDAQKANREKTCLSRYGEVAAMKNKDVSERSRKNCKKLREEGKLDTKEKREQRIAQKEKVKQSLPSRDSVVQYYIIEGHSQEDTMLHFGFSNSLFLKFKRENGITKPRMATRNLYAQNAVKNLEEKAKEIRDYLLNLGHKPTIKDLADHFGCAYNTMRCYLAAAGMETDDYIDFVSAYSYEEKEVLDFVSGLGVKTESNVKVLDGREIDIYCPDYNVGIEFNGDYWHCDKFKDKNYHFKKSVDAANNGIHLIHIYEYEWRNEVKQRLIKSYLSLVFGKVPNRIYARQCEIKEITNAEAKPFNDANHLQKHRNAQVTYGLFYKGQLVQLMSFSKTKYNRNLQGDNDWEIIRGCPGSVNLVVGGVSKLFAHFVKDHNPEKVFSYCDFNKFSGKSYEAIGMTFVGYTGPDKVWIVDGEAVGRNPSRYKELKEKAEYSIYGAGSKKYIWTNPYFIKNGQ